MKTNKKLLALLLAVVMTFSLSVTAFAWNQFQKDSSHNGIVTSGGLPTGKVLTVKEQIDLTRSETWTDDSGLPGVDAPPIIVGNTAYVLYYAGSGSTEDNDGVRVSAVNLSNSPTQTWSVKVGRGLDADNIQQLGTMYYDEDSSTLFAPVTYTKDIINGLDKTASGGASLDFDGLLTVTANEEGSITIPNVVIEGSTKMTYFATGITVPEDHTISGDVTFTKADGTTQSFGTSNGYEGYEFCLYNNGDAITAGTYTVTITLTSDFNATGTVKVRSSSPYWRLYQLAATSTTCTSVNPVQTADGSYVGGAGQMNTPITGTTYNGHKYIYFGIYDGDRAYYQYDHTTTQGTLIAFTPSEANDGFYWAGAAVVDSNVVFGAENGYVYSRPIGSTFGTAAGSKVNLLSSQPNAGKVRSSICYYDNYLYLTTSNAYLWRLNTSLTDVSSKRFADDQYVVNSSSTPVASTSGYIYVGGYNIYWDDNNTRVYKGALKYIKLADWDIMDTGLVTGWYGDDSAAIQSSPIVYRNTSFRRDYVYFTTNGPEGKAVCQVLSAGGGLYANWSYESGTYTLQGFAVSDKGYMVYGNDNAKLWVYHK